MVITWDSDSQIPKTQVRALVAPLIFFKIRFESFKFDRSSLEGNKPGIENLFWMGGFFGGDLCTVINVSFSSVSVFSQ